MIRDLLFLSPSFPGEGYMIRDLLFLFLASQEMATLYRMVMFWCCIVFMILQVVTTQPMRAEEAKMRCVLQTWCTTRLMWFLLHAID